MFLFHTAPWVNSSFKNVELSRKEWKSAQLSIRNVYRYSIFIDIYRFSKSSLCLGFFGKHCSDYFFMRGLLRRGSLPGLPFHMLNGVEYVSAWSRETIWWRGTSGIAREMKNTKLIRPPRCRLTFRLTRGTGLYIHLSHSAGGFSPQKPGGLLPEASHDKKQTTLSRDVPVALSRTHVVRKPDWTQTSTPPLTSSHLDDYCVL